MKALYQEAVHKAVLKDVEKPVLKSEKDVLVKITSTTICGSDVHIIEGVIPTKPGFVLGHEYVGVIEEVGSEVKKFKIGDRVTGPPAPYCGECINCKRGNVAHCLNGGIHGSGEAMGGLDGTHAEYMSVPHADNCLLKLPANITDEQAIFVSDIAATGYSAAVHFGVKNTDNVVVFGCGPVGLSAIATTKLHNPKTIIAVEKSKNRLKKAFEMGATHGVVVGEDNVLAKIAEYTNNFGADLVIDAVGLEVTINQGLECLGINGNLYMVGIPAKPVAIDPKHFFKNITFAMGLGNLTIIETLLNKVIEGKLDLTPLITHTMKLTEIEKALDMFMNNPDEVVKIIIKP
ncbi:alcohol dehydrogenase catalytic domain-containing protein [Clostridium sp. 'deep sea']|uniref:zinc-dependent alcohol dehydrogenase n=1 Tax=Clostridium sp. 'deep sea' TaxID=2779445 RepID=UPI0018963F41|nr:alcohol dehydrogenase catalytic domain-containing protein [Clostridium sp. 'deep sea']QOR36345.1 alcohol dehydrogenase catalytic domain-containing protein [Clostridium sp. 'deep sea']